MTINSRNGAAAKRLDNSALANVPDASNRAGYDRRVISPGTIHIGPGAFCRDHVMVYTKDVLTYERMKRRCLNGSHSTLAYLSVIAGIETIADAMTDADLPKVIRRLWDEDLIPTLPPVPSADAAAYTYDLDARFRDDGLRHLTLQISWDGSQKLPPRLLEAAAELYSSGRKPKVIPLAVAAWMRFLSGRNELGQDYVIIDPHAERLVRIANDAGSDAARLVDGLFGIREIFADVLHANVHFRAEVVRHLSNLMNHGVRKTLKSFLGEV